jgi:putative chitinase
MELSLEQFQVAVGADEAHAATYYEHVLATMDRYNISRIEEVSAFLATISIESARLTHVEEDLYYRDPERIAKLFKRAFDTNHDGVITQDEIDHARPYCRMPKELSQKLYNGCHGRGLIQLTWEKNYQLCGDALGIDFVSEPSLLCTPEYAALSAGWFWDTNNINSVADNMDEVTLRVNGPRRLALAERIAQRDIVLGVFA